MSREQERRNIWWAVLASLFLHVVIALSLATFNSTAMPLPSDEDKPVELTMVDLPAARPPSMPVNPPYMETDPSRESAEKPKQETFESNANSLAASSAPATGEAPVPSQEGKDRPYMELKTQDLSLPTIARPAVEKQPTPPPQPSATATAVATPKPRASAAPTATPMATPQPLVTPEPDKLAMLTATPPPALRDPEDVEETPEPQVGPTTPPPTMRPQPTSAASMYRPEKEQTRITGRISDRGPSAVNAVGTPLGKYKKQVTDAIGSRWYYYMKAKLDLVNIGTAHIEAEVDRGGKITNLRVISNDANESFANICLQSFQEAQIPPIPPDLVATLPEGKLPVDIYFTTYTNR